MMHYHVNFESAWWLLLMGLAPLFWWFGYRRLAILGGARRTMALLLRSAIWILAVLALAEANMVRMSDRLTVLYLLDQSQSIPPQSRRAMIEYVNEAVRRHRADKDCVGVIVFGREAIIEVPAFDYNLELPSPLESLIDPDYTNLAAAMRLALASFPEDAARRMVVVSDGNENLGNALDEARQLAAAGVGIDVVPIRYAKRGEVIVERVILPNDVRHGQPFDLKVVISNSRQAASPSGEIPGRLVLKRKIGGREEVVSDQPVSLAADQKKVFLVRQQLDSAGFVTYEAEFQPDRPGDDALRQNNRASTFTHVLGKGRVLVIENPRARNAANTTGWPRHWRSTPSRSRFARRARPSPRLRNCNSSTP